MEVITVGLIDCVGLVGWVVWRGRGGIWDFLILEDIAKGAWRFLVCLHDFTRIIVRIRSSNKRR